MTVLVAANSAGSVHHLVLDFGLWGQDEHTALAFAGNHCLWLNRALQYMPLSTASTVREPSQDD